MTVDIGENVFPRDAGGDRILEIAIRNYEDAILDLHNLKQSIRASGSLSDAEVRRAISMASKTIQVIYEERKRLDALSQTPGDASGGEFDFDAARAEIRGRLDRIRASVNPGELPV